MADCSNLARGWSDIPISRRAWLGFGLLLSLPVAAAIAESASVGQSAPSDSYGPSATSSVEVIVPDSERWWSAGVGRTMAARVAYADPSGRVGLVNTSGPIDTNDNAFFQPLGSNGRACVTCHQPADAMGISTATIQRRWAETAGKDPLFASIDGSNCPSLPQQLPASHSLLLKRGLFRIALPWPPKTYDGVPINPEFAIEVIRDPTGCNSSAIYGIKSPNPMVSVFRRPRIVANLRYAVDVRADAMFSVKTGMPLAKDPETGNRVNMNLMYDGRELNQKTQAINAHLTHLQGKTPLMPEQIKQIITFESQIYVAQDYDTLAGDLTGPGTPKGLGPVALSTARASQAGDRLNTPTFQLFGEWKTPEIANDSSPEGKYRASVARGADLFMTKLFWQRDLWGLTNGGSGNPMKRSCSTCHNSQMTGMDNAPGWFDVGMDNLPWSDPNPDLPLFRLTCRKDVDQHPYLGRVILTHDPGRALISGKCADIGALTVQQMRGLAARAPYFSNGSAKDLAAVLSFYERRFKFKYTPQEKQDLVNFLSVL
jgi:hypothetical protein